MENINYTKMDAISTKEAKIIIEKNKNNPNFELIDVRTEGEFSSGFIQTAKNIPLDKLGLKLKELSKEKEYLLYCRTDGRSSYAVQALKSQGFNVKYIIGGYLEWIRENK